MEKAKTIESTVPGVVAHIYYDTDPECPEDDIVQIAYSSSRNCLGTQNCSRAELDEIRDGIESGKYVGVRVWAYVHGGATISTGTKLHGDSKVRLRENPFSCPWDSGQSGFAYMTRENALREWGKKRLSAQQKAKALAYIDGVVDTFDQYLRGDMYGYQVVDSRGGSDDVVDSCWGYYGMDDVTREAQDAMAAHITNTPVQQELALES